ncbi:serine hydrolase domain-containing protein [Aquimarina spongiae]|uniref:CubicO group peptidase, beta-lactamase class C family n=1 Tax=Aquimarina spongiae TaxID=570521 RepID=A0A1M6B6D1_9FLAO|nr:serine hydrolase domain-containing protein [Aquimarina spongiae]SHI44265.1 CubicO group peptidase, beta-lactamase class C family [Aquimarina spongiae]
MKNVFSVLLTLILFQSSAQESNTDTTIDMIKKVETGLTNQVHIEGDSTWSIEERMKHYGILGVSIAVIHNGEVAWAKGYGVLDKESKVPVTDKTLFQVSTIGMSLTAYAALRLVDQDKVTLNKDINSYLKSWKLPDSEFTKEKKVTLKNLLSHSAGINVHAFQGYSTGEPVPTLLEILNGTSPANSNPVIVDKAINENLWISAGGYTIIQQMMMDVEGKKFPDLMNELVLQPLEMNNSRFDQSLSTAQLKTAATGYLRDGSMVKGKRHIYPELASNGLWTTAEDLAKFVINIQQTLKDKSNKGLSKDMAELMLTPSSKNRYGKYGLGFLLYDKKDELYFEHHGWSTGFYSRMTAHKDNGYGVVVLTNTPLPAFVFEVFRSVALAYKWDNYFPVYKKMEIEQSLADKITGRYSNNGRVVQVFQKENQLLYKNIVDSKAEELVKVSDSSFARRNSSRIIQFKPNSENEILNLLYINSNDGTIVSTFDKADANKKEPVEFLLEGNFDEALNAYRALKKQDSTYLTVTEDYLNDLGHRFLRENRIKLAQDAFKVNIVLYPYSFEVYESYAEACAKNGEIDLAILNYTKSLELNPQNNNTRHKIKELQKSE